MKTIYLHGYLNDLHPEPIKVVAESVAEAISALALIPAFNPRKGKQHSVVIDGFFTESAINDKTDVEEIHVRPMVFAGGGNGGLFQMIIGAILIVVGFLLTPMFPMLGPLLIKVGLTMVLGGIIQMLMPQPKLEGVGEDEMRSQYLGARGNTVAIGTTIPMIFGRHKAWGHYLSFDVDAGDLNTTPASWYASSLTDFGELTYAAAPEEVPSLDPQEEAGIPIGYFAGLSGTTLSFTPSIDLPQGGVDVMFNTGRTLHCFNAVSGVTNFVTVQGGNTSDLPATGTPIVFSQNYV